VNLIRKPWLFQVQSVGEHSLEQIFRRKLCPVPLEPTSACHQMASALSFLHKHDILHMSLKVASCYECGAKFRWNDARIRLLCYWRSQFALQTQRNSAAVSIISIAVCESGACCEYRAKARCGGLASIIPRWFRLLHCCSSLGQFWPTFERNPDVVFRYPFILARKLFVLSLQPTNVLVDPDGAVRLTDYGVHRRCVTSEQRNAQNATTSSSCWMARESLSTESEATFTKQSDVAVSEQLLYCCSYEW